jgi:hypothetical protein
VGSQDGQNVEGITSCRVRRVPVGECVVLVTYVIKLAVRSGKLGGVPQVAGAVLGVVEERGEVALDTVVVVVDEAEVVPQRLACIPCGVPEGIPGRLEPVRFSQSVSEIRRVGRSGGSLGGV